MENQASAIPKPADTAGPIAYANPDEGDHGRRPGRWTNRAAVIAVATPLLVLGYCRLGEHDTRRHLLGWTFIFHHDRSMAVWTPWNNLFAIDLSGMIAVAVIVSVLYLIVWGLRKMAAFLSGN